MPSRKRAREAAKIAAGNSAPNRKKPGKTKSKHKKKHRNKRKTAKAKSSGPKLDPSATDDAETRFVQPYEATKTYLCPGCNRDIPPGVGHLVAVPPDEPDLRRHWHRGCWHHRHSRF